MEQITITKTGYQVRMHMAMDRNSAVLSLAALLHTDPNFREYVVLAMEAYCNPEFQSLVEQSKTQFVNLNK